MANTIFRAEQGIYTGGNISIGGNTTPGSKITVQDSLTANSSTTVNIATTWNGGTANTFTGIQLNVTDTSSNASSSLMDMQVGGTSRFKVDKNGNITIGATSITQPSSGTFTLGSTLVQLGGNSAAFPAIKRNAAGVDVRLADDSAFAALSALSGTFNDTSNNVSSIATTGYTLTGSSDVPLMNMAGTWNTTGTPTAIKLNITDTASNASSLLLDLQLGGSSKFKIGKSGTVTLAGDLTVPAYNIVTDTTTGMKIATTTTQKLGFFGATPVIQGVKITDKLTTITYTPPVTPDYAVQDLVNSLVGAAFGFATKDEGNSVLAVIANLQARVNDLENRLVAYGLLANTV